MKVTIRDVAQRAGVSIATVSNVMSGRKPVTEALKTRVIAAAEALDYQIDRAASQLRSGRTRIVGVSVPNFNDTFFTGLVSGIESLAAAAGYQVVVVSAQDDPQIEAARLEALFGWRPSGIIAVPATNMIPERLRREVASLPIVLVDRVGQDDLGFDTVTVDNIAAGREAAAHLVAQGHRHIAIAASVSAFRPIAERIAGVAAVCAEHGLDAPCVVDLGIDHARGADVMYEWLADRARLSAIVAMTNVTTLATLSALARRGIDVPEAMSLIGFDDYLWMTARRVPLTAMRQPIDEIATHAWAQLIRRIGQKGHAGHKIILPASLQCRASVGPPPDD